MDEQPIANTMMTQVVFVSNGLLASRQKNSHFKDVALEMTHQLLMKWTFYYVNQTMAPEALDSGSR